MMELGATLCSPKSPQCLLCPVAQFCEGRKLGIAESLPEKRKKRATVEVILAAAVFTDERGRTLLLLPPKNTKEKTADHVPTLVSRMWHFPTISVNGEAAANLTAFLKKVFPGNSPREWALVPAGKVRHSVTYRAVTILPFRIEVNKLPRVHGAKQIALNGISGVPISNLTRKVARAALAAANSTPGKR